ncbi:hypothetical protein HDU83_008695 [Entophlyctis luteolus]|nr:hypothetical protein HDU82_003379 [Entophlyctis luteolus]KAJ3351793.1 hypothetical protein HDU83_008695 [Entophlyctis luteolus]
MASTALAAAIASLNPAQRAELSSLSADQLEILLHAPPRVMTEGQLLTVLVYVYSCGVILCGAVVLAAAVNRQRLLRTSMDRITMALVLVCFVWSVVRAIIHAMQGFGSLDLGNAPAAAFSNIMIVLIFELNSHLAMERYFQIKEHPYKTIIYGGLWSFFVATVGIIFWVFSTSVSSGRVVSLRVLSPLTKRTKIFISKIKPTSDGIKPDNKPQQTVWIVMLCLQYAVTTLLMAWFYTRTYRYSAREFKENPALAEFFLRADDGKKESPETLRLVRLRVERQILTKCLFLSLTVMIFYAPFLTYQIQSYVVGAIPFFDITGIYYVIGVIMIAADVSLTAILVIAFKKEVRDSFAFWNY